MKDEEPPSPPRIPPEVRLYRTEKIGLPILFLLPILALAGLFGPTVETAGARSGSIEWTAEYPSRLRFEKAERLIVRMRNTGEAPVSQTSLTLDPAYVHAFSPVTFEPAAQTPYRVESGSLQPGESRLVAVDLTADEYGWHSGWIELSADGAESRLELDTFIFP